MTKADKILFLKEQLRALKLRATHFSVRNYNEIKGYYERKLARLNEPQTAPFKSLSL